MAHRLSPQAERNLDQIWVYTAKESGSAEVATQFVDSITERFLLLSQYPLVGRIRDDLEPGLRSYPVGRYLIIYEIENMRDVLIHNVIAAARDIKALFLE